LHSTGNANTDFSQQNENQDHLKDHQNHILNHNHASNSHHMINHTPQKLNKDKDQEKAISFDELCRHLPKGNISASDIESLIQRVYRGVHGLSYAGLMSAIRGHFRYFAGSVIKPLLIKAMTTAVETRFLSKRKFEAMKNLVNKLIDVRIEADDVYLKFDFGSDKELYIDVPMDKCLVLRSGNVSNPFLASDSNNQVEEYLPDVKQLLLKHEIKLTLGPAGIDKVREGDIRFVKFLKFNVSLKMNWRQFDIDVDQLDRPKLETTRVYNKKSSKSTDEEDFVEQAVIVDGKYVPVRADMWLSLTVLGKEANFPMPRIPLLPQ
jgi:hypothetical protein